jgi:hypothetical protein
LENPKIPQLPKNLPISNPVAKVQFPKSKNYPTRKVQRQIGAILTILHIMAYLNLSTVESFTKIKFRLNKTTGLGDNWSILVSYHWVPSPPEKASPERKHGGPFMRGPQKSGAA